MQNSNRPCKLNLALQGGGAHGAFTWGVLDRLLEDGRFDFGWVSATSAGAVNAVALAAGLLDGRDGARTKLTQVWAAVSGAGVPDLRSERRVRGSNRHGLVIAGPCIRSPRHA